MTFQHKKGLGQHFLNRDDLALSIVKQFAERVGDLPILEIGPGAGALTKHISELSNPLFLNEMDRRLVEPLQLNYPRAKVYEGDFLSLDWDSLFLTDFALIGNFPYNISSQIVFKLLELNEKVPFCTGMFQYEVALRISASKGSKAYGILSVLVDVLFECEMVMELEPEDFSPPPKVRSAVLNFKRRDVPLYNDFKSLKQVVKLAFNQRRKKLSNSLKSIIPEDFERVDWMDLRPEQVDTQLFIEITKALKS